MKRTPVPSVKLDPNEIQSIVSTVFDTVESRLLPQFYLLDVTFEKEMGAWFLRIYIEGLHTPVSLNDCADVSLALDPHIDGLKPLQNLPYSLEVSSPGLFRPLRTAREFAFYKGHPVRIAQQKQQPAKSRKNVPPEYQELANGILLGFDEPAEQVSIQQAGTNAPNNVLELPLTPNTQVFLNPAIRFPDVEGASEQGGGAADLNNQELSEESHD